jgi:integrase
MATLLREEHERQQRIRAEILTGRKIPEGLPTRLPDLPAGALIFPNDLEAPELPRHPDTMTKTFRRAAKRLGFEGITPHVFRHSNISYILKMGGTLADASKRAGHSTPHVTASVYSHALEEIDRHAADVASGLISNPKA